MNQDSNAILTLCSHISAGDGIFPLEPKEYSQLAATLYRAGNSPGIFWGSQQMISKCI